jgi:hypothetical protein
MVRTNPGSTLKTARELFIMIWSPPRKNRERWRFDKISTPGLKKYFPWPQIVPFSMDRIRRGDGLRS